MEATLVFSAFALFGAGIWWAVSGTYAWAAGTVTLLFAVLAIAAHKERLNSKATYADKALSKDWVKHAEEVQRKHLLLPDAEEDHGAPEIQSGLVEWRQDKAYLKDYLGEAAAELRSAKNASSAGRFDEAWRSFNKTKELYLLHASRSGFTPQQTLALDSSVNEHMANQLRLEGRHDEAFVHILYWVMASAHRPIQAHGQKLGAYFRRCKMKNTSLDEVEAFVSSGCPHPDYRTAQAAVAAWKSREREQR